MRTASLIAPALLDAVTSRIEALGGTLPDLRYVTVGQEVQSCEQITCTVGTGFTGSPGQTQPAPYRQGSPLAIDMMVSWVDCWPSDDPIAVDTLQEAASVCLAHFDLLLTAAELSVAGSGTCVGCGGAALTAFGFRAPSGGVVASFVLFSVPL